LDELTVYPSLSLSLSISLSYSLLLSLDKFYIHLLLDINWYGLKSTVDQLVPFQDTIDLDKCSSVTTEKFGTNLALFLSLSLSLSLLLSLDKFCIQLLININWHGMKSTVDQLVPFQDTIDLDKCSSVTTEKFGTNLVLFSTPFSND
jgi:hypothetical protein